MNPFNSIRWRLQIWYGIILVAVLTGFGVTAYQLERGRQLRRIDDGLQRRAATVANLMRPRLRGGPREGFTRDQLERPLPGQPPLEQLPDENPRDRLPPEDLHARLQQSGLFDESDSNGFYYIVWARDGRELTRSTNAPVEVTFPSRDRVRNPESTEAQFNGPPEEPPLPDPVRDPQRPGPLGERQPPQMRGLFREQVLARPPGEIILVGRSIAPEMTEMDRTALKLAGVGGAILLLGLAGGWWIASRAIRPIDDISATAVKISAGDLSQRINVENTENELGRLAGVLNSTFARLETSFAQQQQFTSDAAHELRTPVTVMLTETQTTLNRERPAEDYRRTVEVCQRISQRMRRLIESLLELARLDAGQEQMKRMRFDLSRTAGECVDMVRPLADERSVKVHCELPPIECTGDPERIAQVITNLMTNAIQYNKPGGEVTVQTQQRDGTAILTVSDSGNGIAAEDLPRVFERFYRADKARSTSQGSAGLGLSICKAIVEAHGGTIEVASELGAGTTFTVRLPSENK